MLKPAFRNGFAYEIMNIACPERPLYNDISAEPNGSPQSAMCKGPGIRFICE